MKQDCFWESDINKLRTTLEPYVSPVQTEYSLLSALFLLRIWSEVNEPRRDNCTQEIDENNRENIINEDNERTPLLTQQQSLPANFQSNRSQQSNSIEDENSQTEYSHMDDAVQIVGRMREKRSLSFYLIILFGIAVITPVFVALLILLSVRRHSPQMHFIWEILRCTFTTIHLLFLILTFRRTKQECNLPVASFKLKGKEYILILSSAGAVAYSTFALLSGVMCRSEDPITKNVALIVIIENIVNIVAIYLQTVLIIYGGRCEQKAGTQTKLIGVQNVFVFLVITNMVSWFNNSFISNRLEYSSLQYGFYSSSWNIINETVFPFVIFYRFHSAMDMYEMYRKFRRISVTTEQIVD